MKHFEFISSGKQGLSLILNYLKQQGVITQKSDELFVPKFMGNWVYSSLNINILTSPKFTENTKVIHLYHQFGIPQKIDEIIKFAKKNNLLVIEDCAHVLSGELNKKEIIGNNGDFTIYSFSKFVNCFLLGGIKSKSKDFDQFIITTINKSSKFLSFFNLLLIISSKFFLSNKLIDINYSLYHHNSKPLKYLINIYNTKIEKEKKIILERYLKFKNEVISFLPYDYLKFDNLICNFLPIDHEKKKIDILANKFNSINAPYRKLFYDKNRNMLDPNFVLAIGLEIGSQNKYFEKQLEIIKEVYK